MTDEQIKALIAKEIKNALSQNQLEIVTSHHVGLPTTTYVRFKLEYPYGQYSPGFNSQTWYETVEETSIPELFGKLMRALESMGLELYHIPSKNSEWGFRKKKDETPSAG